MFVSRGAAPFGIREHFGAVPKEVVPVPEPRMADRLRAAIERSDFSQTYLADKLHRSRSAISEWKSGRSEPDLATFAQLCKLLGRSADDVLGITRPAPSQADLSEVAAHIQAAAAVMVDYVDDSQRRAAMDAVVRGGAALRRLRNRKTRPAGVGGAG